MCWTTRVFTRAAVIIFFPDSVLFTFGYFTCRSVSQLCRSAVDTNCDASLYIGAAWYNDNDDDDHHQYTTTHCATHYTEIVLHSTIMISSEQIHVDNHHNALFFVHTGSPTALLAICERESQQLFLHQCPHLSRSPCLFSLYVDQMQTSWVPPPMPPPSQNLPHLPKTTLHLWMLPESGVPTVTLTWSLKAPIASFLFGRFHRCDKSLQNKLYCILRARGAILFDQWAAVSGNHAHLNGNSRSRATPPYSTMVPTPPNIFLPHMYV